MKILKIILSGFFIKCFYPNNFKVVKIDTFSNTIAIASVRPEAVAYMDSESARISVAKDPNLQIPIISQYYD